MPRHINSGAVQPTKEAVKSLSSPRVNVQASYHRLTVKHVPILSCEQPSGKTFLIHRGQRTVKMHQLRIITCLMMVVCACGLLHDKSRGFQVSVMD